MQATTITINEGTTFAELDEAILSVIRSNPDRTNPRDSAGNCVYENAERKRCLIGELLHEAGRLTKDIVEENDTADDVLMGIVRSPEVANRARAWQKLADGVEDVHPRGGLTWAECARHMGFDL